MSDAPLASYEDPRWFPANVSPVGNRGFSGVRGTLTTALTGTNNNLAITARDAIYPNDPLIRVQYSVLATGAPGWLYEDGLPAILKPTTDLGFEIIMKKAGTQGNGFTVTLVDPGSVHSLVIERPAAKDLVVVLAHNNTAVTSVPADLIAAINGDPELSEYMMAFASSAVVAPLPATAKEAFKGGADIPHLVLVSLGATPTGATTQALLNGSKYVKAAPASGSDGTGAVVAMPATALTAGTSNRGDVSEQYVTRRNAWTARRLPGNPLGKEHNKTLQLRGTRFGAPRSYQRVPTQDRAIVNSSLYNYQTDRLAAATLG